jgi:hypothetical protein
MVVHLAIYDGGPGVSPLCGFWGESGDWTLERGAVSCPLCLATLRAREQALGVQPVSALRPDQTRFTPWPAVVRSPAGRTTS